MTDKNRHKRQLIPETTSEQRRRRQHIDADAWKAATADVTPLSTRHPAVLAKPLQPCPKPPKRRDRIDLHGMTVEEAYVATQQFVEALPRSGVVVTGRSGIIRREFEEWLRQKAGVVRVEELSSGGAFRIHRKGA